MGYNHHFGKDRQGNRNFLETLKEEYDLKIVQLPKQEVDARKVSSTVLRFLVRSGDLKAARELLTRPYFFIGRRGICGLMEYDEPLKQFPPQGVYPVSVEDGTLSYDTNLLILPGNKLGLPIPAQSHCAPGERMIVRFKDPLRHSATE